MIIKTSQEERYFNYGYIFILVIFFITYKLIKYIFLKKDKKDTYIKCVKYSLAVYLLSAISYYFWFYNIDFNLNLIEKLMKSAGYALWVLSPLSALGIIYGGLKYYIAGFRKNNEMENSAKKIIAYNLLIIIAVSFVYSITRPIAY